MDRNPILKALLVLIMVSFRLSYYEVNGMADPPAPLQNPVSLPLPHSFCLSADEHKLDHARTRQHFE